MVFQFQSLRSFYKVYSIPYKLREFFSSYFNFIILKNLVNCGFLFLSFSFIIKLVARTSYVEVPPELDEAFKRALMPSERFVFCRIIPKRILFSRSRKLGISARSLFKKFSSIWKTFSEEQKQAWKEAASVIGLNGWQLFVKDQSARLKAGFSGIATPSIYHQSYTGFIVLDDFTDELKIVQLHPRTQWILKKVKGTKSQYEPVKITEDFSLPLTLKINYYSQLEAGSEDYIAKFYAEIWHSYQGQDLKTKLEINFDLLTDWKSAEVSVSNLAGYVVGYKLYFHFKNVKGSFHFDNIQAIHSGQNWVRDWTCENIRYVSTRKFFQVPAHWFVEIKTDGADFDSVYIDW